MAGRPNNLNRAGQPQVRRPPPRPSRRRPLRYPRLPRAPRPQARPRRHPRRRAPSRRRRRALIPTLRRIPRRTPRPTPPPISRTQRHRPPRRAHRHRPRPCRALGRPYRRHGAGASDGSSRVVTAALTMPNAVPGYHGRSNRSGTATHGKSANSVGKKRDSCNPAKRSSDCRWSAS